MPLCVSQVGFCGGHVLLIGHLGPCRREPDLGRHGSAGTCHLAPQYAESRGDERKPLLDRLGPPLQSGCPLSGQQLPVTRRFVFRAKRLVSLGPVALL
ncbi:MAG: hypothetical protein ACK559_29805, partial [bacterium]